MACSSPCHPERVGGLPPTVSTEGRGVELPPHRAAGLHQCRSTSLVSSATLTAIIALKGALLVAAPNGLRLQRQHVAPFHAIHVSENHAVARPALEETIAHSSKVKTTRGSSWQDLRKWKWFQQGQHSMNSDEESDEESDDDRMSQEELSRLCIERLTLLTSLG